MSSEYNNPTPVAVALIRVLDHSEPIPEFKLLAGRRAIAPKIGEFAFPGGFVNEGESAETAVAREVQEEIGIRLAPECFRPVATRITPRNQLLIFCVYEKVLIDVAIEALFTPSSECDAFHLVTADDTLCFPLHTEILSRENLWRPEG